ncbi:MAG: hypothetical protein M1838_002993 [Thelocarpon superellum]|nr:MAG: hypothetical protein M1838_002993 [Thelocarpon superellum]
MNTITAMLAPPLLVAWCIPLAGFALFTSLIAFSALLLRVLMVYIELGVVIVHDYFTASSSSASIQAPSARQVEAATTWTPINLPRPRPLPLPSKSRRSSGAAGGIMLGSASGGTTTSSASSTTSTITGPNPTAATPTPAFDAFPIATRANAGGGTELDPLNRPSMPANDSGGFVRDFEGVGGWRIADPDEDEEAQWTMVNSRLELPAAPDRKRRHRRSVTAGTDPSFLAAAGGATTPGLGGNGGGAGTVPGSAAGAGSSRQRRDPVAYGASVSPLLTRPRSPSSSSANMSLSMSAAASSSSSYMTGYFPQLPPPPSLGPQGSTDAGPKGKEGVAPGAQKTPPTSAPTSAFPARSSSRASQHQLGRTS